jgi:2-haloalkanoic acid dehalogenase type II
MFDLLSRAEAYAEVNEVLAGLRRAGLTLLVASNADDRHLYPALEREGIEVDHVISSEAVRSYKPRRPFFDAVVERVGCEPAQIIYVGDNPYADVTGARNAGMLSYWVRRYEDESQAKLLKADPHWTFPDLRGLLTLLTGPAPAQNNAQNELRK